MTWNPGSTPLAWDVNSADLHWYTGTVLTGVPVTDAGGFPAVAVTGLPANTLVARPGEFLTVFEDAADTTGETVMIANAARSDDTGRATVRLLSALSHGGRVNIGTSDTGVFRVIGPLPRAVQPRSANWSYTWNFEEVFADQVPDGYGFLEIDPWT